LNSTTTSPKICSPISYFLSPKTLLCFAWLLAAGTALSQLSSHHIKARVETIDFINEPGFTHAADLLLFYRNLQYQPAWLHKDRLRMTDQLIHTLQQATLFGLETEDYQYRFILSFSQRRFPLITASDSLEAELRLSDAAIHFYSDIAYGNKKPVFGYNGLSYQPSCYSIISLLPDHLFQNKLSQLPNRLSDGLKELPILQYALIRINAVLADTNFREVSIRSNKAVFDNIPLITKLKQLGIIDSVDKRIPDAELKEKIKEAQRQFNLLADGYLRITSLEALNVPISKRLQQLKLAINNYRWLSCLSQQQPVIVVNVPATHLTVYYNREILLFMRIIAGKPATPTPTLSSTIDEVILYPYWHVPYSIATKELLPLIKRNPAYIDANNYQVLDQQGKIMDPYTISWHLYSTSYFPFLIRQSTGCDNALGLIKFNFYNPFSVYLHDTPGKPLFALNKRFFSHGCMRLEQPMELGHLVLKNNPISIDTLEQKGCLRNQQPVIVPVPQSMPVIVWYSLVDVDSTGRVIFFEDIYKKQN
jgi:L,D-transpeptidase YcbB